MKRTLPGSSTATRRLVPLRAFTLIELLVVVATIASLASLLLPALGKAKAKAQSISCLSNLKQLQLCWQMYADDHNDIMAPNKWGSSGAGGPISFAGSWLAGSARVDRNTTNIENGVLFPYNRSTAIYHCPADRSTIEETYQRFRFLPGLRTRSYSINCWLNGMEWPEGRESRFVKSTQLVNPPPVRVFVFLDEHEKTIEDGLFALNRKSSRNWQNMPADRHSQGFNFSYADGHAERMKWRWPKSLRDLQWEKPVANAQDLQDLQALQETIPQ